MAEEKPVACVAPAAGPIVPHVELPHTDPLPGSGKPKGDQMAVMVGKTAPDFEAAAFAGGGFKNVKLSDFRGRWVFLCFYPGDFTFV